MRNQEQVLKEIKDWGSTRADVRCILLTSSRANPDAPIDLFSDYDIELVVNDPGYFIENQEWALNFGEILAILRTGEDANGGTHSMCMVIFKDYTKIDFTIYSIAQFKDAVAARQFNKNGIGKVLVDKDEITAGLPPPDFKVHNIIKPSAEEFNTVVADFLWDTTYVAKSLWRDEIFFAKYMLDHIIRFSYLQKIVEWFIGIKNNWEVTTNKHGRFFKHFLDKDTFSDLEKTFSGSVIDENWESLFAMIEIFGKLARSIANKLNYEYPQQLENDIISYLRQVRHLDKKAIDL